MTHFDFIIPDVKNVSSTYHGNWDDDWAEVLPVNGVKVEAVIGHLTEYTRPIFETRYDLIFCPGNSFGHMTGGFDKGVVDVYGDAVETAVREMIAQKYFGMMPVGASEVVTVNGRGFVYTPTMMVPTPYTGMVDPYMLMFQSLHAVLRYERETGLTFQRALCPLFCAGTGGSTPKVALRQQSRALTEFHAGLGGASLGCKDLFRDATSRYMTLAR